MSTSAHLTKVKLLDFPCLSVYRSGKPLHIWQGWNPSTSLIRCSTHMWAPLHLAKVRVLDFRTLSAYTFVHVVASSQSETPRLPQFVCGTFVSVYTSDKSETPRLPFTHLSTPTHLTKRSLLDFILVCKRVVSFAPGLLCTWLYIGSFSLCSSCVCWS